MSQFLCDLANCISSEEVKHAPGNILGYHVVWPIRFVAVPVCSRFGLWPFRFVAVSVCGRFDLWPFSFVAVSFCGRSGLWPFRFVAVSVVAISVCGRFDLLPNWICIDNIQFLWENVTITCLCLLRSVNCLRELYWMSTLNFINCEWIFKHFKHIVSWKYSNISKDITPVTER